VCAGQKKMSAYAFERLNNGVSRCARAQDDNVNRKSDLVFAKLLKGRLLRNRVEQVNRRAFMRINLHTKSRGRIFLKRAAFAFVQGKGLIDHEARKP
jgi:hypothetical protein